MIDTSEVVVRSVLDELLESSDVVEECYHLGCPLLILCQAKLFGQILHFFTGSPTMLFFELQVDIYILIIAIESSYVIVKPSLEFAQLLLLHNSKISNKKRNSFAINLQQTAPIYHQLL
jgi:hypothetical protein